jgi:UDP:flavonoid glycosyltransferase YjiC (YdhE family)
LRGVDDNLDFRAPSVDGFVRDLAGCRAVLSTAGNQLIGEAIHFGKPVLAMPEDAFEQRLNAFMIERMGVGMRGDLKSLTPSDIDRFLGSRDWYRSNMREHAGNGRTEAAETLHGYIDELRRKARVNRRSAGARRTVVRMRPA